MKAKSLKQRKLRISMTILVSTTVAFILLASKGYDLLSKSSLAKAVTYTTSMAGKTLHSHVSTAEHSSIGTDPKFNCSPHLHVFFLKVAKTGSSIVSNVFTKLTWRYNLFARDWTYKLPHPLDIKQDNNGHFKVVKNIHLTNKYDMYFHHCKYRNDKVLKYMHNDTKLVATVRHPFYQYRSRFYFRQNYNRFLEASSVKAQYAKQEEMFLGLLYEPIHVTSAGNYEFVTHTLKPTQNFMFKYFNGNAAEAVRDKSYLNKYLQEIHRNFSNVLINEHMDESLVLLKRSLCLSIKDILYLNHKNASYSAKNKTPEEYGELNERLKHLLSVDYVLYDFFSKIHKEKVIKEGISFQRELETFQNINHQVQKFCSDINLKMKNITLLRRLMRNKITFQKTEFSEEISLTGEDCVLMVYHVACYRAAFRARDYPQGCNNVEYPVQVKNKRYCQSNKDNFLFDNIPIPNNNKTLCQDV